MKKNSHIVLLIAIIAVIILVAYILFKPKTSITFTINKEQMNIIVGKQERVDYTISDKTINITWTSDNTNIATVNNDGDVTGINAGNAIITGEINKYGQKQTIYCFVTVKPLNYDIQLEDIMLPDGEVLIPTMQTYSLPITYVPSDAYIKEINYIVEKNDIAKVENNQIIGLKPGFTTLTVVVNNNISKDIIINVTNDNISSQIIPTIKELSLNEVNSININEERKLEYNINPSNAIVYDILWESSDKDIATISSDGVIKGLTTGTTTISLTINNRIKKTMNLIVKNAIENIKFDYIPKQVLKVGETYILHPTILPKNNSGNIIYESSNPNVLSVQNNGLIIAKSAGYSTITIKSKDNSISKKLTFTILNKTGVINSTQYIWAFNKETDTIPKKADINFFRKLATNGIGVLTDNNYVYQKYSYNINNSVLTINNSNKIPMRIYYPDNVDLSTLNTFTFIGGIGEENFGGYFINIEKDKSLIKSSGIIILIPEGSIKVYKENVVEATNFVKSIIRQNQYARNSIGGYSNGGPLAGETAEIGNYDKIMLINTSFYWVGSKKNITNKEIVIYTANNDSWRGTDSFINELYKNNIKNVTIISNNPNMSSAFGSKYLVINPGNAMENGHTSNNLTKSHYFSYACD